MTGFDFSSKRILIVDPDYKVIDHARKIFFQAGVKDYRSALDEDEALAVLDEFRPDLVMVEFRFPTTTGIDIIEKIRTHKDGTFQDLPILLMLTKVKESLMKLACEAGIMGVVRKPLEADKVEKFARSVMSQPKRFVCKDGYFGPERREDMPASFEGTDRRASAILDKDTADLMAFVSSKSSVPDSLGSTDDIFPSSETRKEPNAEASVLKAGASKPRAEASTMDVSSSPRASGGAAVIDMGKMPSGDSMPLVDESPAEPAKAKPEELEVVPKPEKKKKAKPAPPEPEATPAPKPAKKKAAKKVEPAPEKTPEKPKVEPPPPPEPEKKPQPVETAEPETPEGEEELVTLEEAMDLHKLWVDTDTREGERANQPKSNFRGKDMAEKDFTGANFRQSVFAGVNCSNSVFRKSDLAGSSFKGAILSNCDFAVSRLKLADMRGVKLDRANLLGADLTKANLQGAVVTGANFTGANLNGTDLSGVNLTSTKGLNAEQVRRAKTDTRTALPASIRKT